MIENEPLFIEIGPQNIYQLTPFCLKKQQYNVQVQVGYDGTCVPVTRNTTDIGKLVYVQV